MYLNSLLSNFSTPSYATAVYGAVHLACKKRPWMESRSALLGCTLRIETRLYKAYSFLYAFSSFSGACFFGAVTISEFTYALPLYTGSQATMKKLAKITGPTCCFSRISSTCQPFWKNFQLTLYDFSLWYLCWNRAVPCMSWASWPWRWLWQKGTHVPWSKPSPWRDCSRWELL